LFHGPVVRAEQTLNIQEVDAEGVYSMELGQPASFKVFI
jgi:hypothetical protein